MCHPAWGPAHAPAPYPRELERVRRLRDLMDRACAAQDAAGVLALDVAALASRAGVSTDQLAVEFARAFGIPLHDYIASRRAESPALAP